MAQRAMPWFRMYGKALSNPKIGRLSDAEFRLWVNLMMVVSNNDDPDQRSQGDTGKSVGDCAWLLRLDDATLQGTLQGLVNADLVTVQATGTLRVLGWEKYQFASDNSTERSRKARAKAKAEKQGKTGAGAKRNGKATSRASSHATAHATNRAVQEADTETDTETEKNPTTSTTNTDSDALEPGVGIEIDLAEDRMWLELIEIYPGIKPSDIHPASLEWIKLSLPQRIKATDDVKRRIDHAGTGMRHKPWFDEAGRWVPALLSYLADGKQRYWKNPAPCEVLPYDMDASRSMDEIYENFRAANGGNR